MVPVPTLCTIVTSNIVIVIVIEIAYVNVFAIALDFALASHCH